jgi:hypothetical protein
MPKYITVVTIYSDPKASGAYLLNYQDRKRLTGKQNKQILHAFYTLVMKERKLLWIKIVHTMIWLFFNVVIFYLLYAVIVNKIDWRVWGCIGLVVIEGLVLAVFNMFCPLTLMARKYSDSSKDNFDIFLPNWLAKYNKLIYTSLFGIAIIILIVRLVFYKNT